MPEDLVNQAVVPGIDAGSRFWGNTQTTGSKGWIAQFLAATPQTQTYFADKPKAYLAVSGGGPDGAFGAGVLCGWGECGDRPEFVIVTGISTGALTAPFALLGDDDTLKEIYTTYKTNDLVGEMLSHLLFKGDAIADSKPLANKIAHYMSPAVIQRLADAYNRKGQHLLIATTNLDADRPVIWDVTRIAATSTLPEKDKRQLICKILLASASIPGVFPPQRFYVTADGKRYTELHVDGNVQAAVYLGPPDLGVDKLPAIADPATAPHIYVIRNGKMIAQYDAVWDGFMSVFGIAGRSISSLLRNQSRNDLYRLYIMARRQQLDYNLAYIPDDYQGAAKELFDQQYMKSLFNLGYDLASNGYPWKKFPPAPYPQPPSPRDDPQETPRESNLAKQATEQLNELQEQPQ